MKAPRLLRPSAALAVALLAVGGLTGCSSTPSAKRVALDMIDTLDISASAKACMVDKVEGYTTEELDKIAELADEGNQEGVAQLQEFEADLATCTARG